MPLVQGFSRLPGKTSTGDLVVSTRSADDEEYQANDKTMISVTPPDATLGVQRTNSVVVSNSLNRSSHTPHLKHLSDGFQFTSCNNRAVGLRAEGEQCK